VIKNVFYNRYYWLSQLSDVQIFISSLLCSGNLSHIKLASDMLQSSAASSRSASPSTLTHDAGENLDYIETAATALRTKLSEDELVGLVLAAAREYFDACATLDDPDLELARQVTHRVTCCHLTLTELSIITDLLVQHLM